MATYELDPISRIEGHLGVELEVNGSNVITGANVHGNLWRGFENFLIGREANDAITFTQRICGVCPVPHGMTSTFAVEAAMGYNEDFQTFNETSYATAGMGVPDAAVHMRNLVLASEFVMSALTHFYHLAAISYVQGPEMPPWTPYFNTNYYNALLKSSGKGVSGTPYLPAETSQGFSANLWSAVIKQYVKALRIRRLTFEAGALFAGRMPMTSSFVAGGVTMAADSTKDNASTNTDRCDLFFDLTSEVADFVVKEHVPVVLALGALYPDYDNTHNTASGTFYGGTATGTGIGSGCQNFLSWGCFPLVGSGVGVQNLTLARGYKVGGGGVTSINAASVEANLLEHIGHSRYADPLGEHTAHASGAAYPGDVTRTVPDRDGGYSWLKAPRFAGNACEVGPYARLVVSDIYPVDGTGLAAAPNLSGQYTKYVKDTTGMGGTIGLRPSLIEPDLAVALMISDAAKLNISGAVVDWPAVSGYTYQAIVDAYTDPGTVIVDGDAIKLTSWIYTMSGGYSTMDRLRGRALEALVLVQAMVGDYGVNGLGSMGGWCKALYDLGDTPDTFNDKDYPVTGAGFGATEAPRGALMHFCTIEDSVISAYQCIVPTTWNACPKDGNGTAGPMEQAIIGAPFLGLTSTYVDGQGVTQTDAATDAVEALRVAQSFDPCIACAVH